MRNRNLLEISLTLILLGSSGVSESVFAKPVSSQLVIDMKDLPDSEKLNGKDVTATAACNKFGALLTKNGGLWGTGPFRSFKCTKSSSDATPEKENQKTSTNTPPRESQWKLQITPGDSSQKFEILHRNEDNTYRTESAYEIETPISPIHLMHREKSAHLIAAYLALGMPYRSFVRGSQILAGSFELSGIKNSKVPLITSPVTIFSLEKNDDIWRAEIVATASIDESSGEQTNDAKGSSTKQTWKIATREIDAISEVKPIHARKLYYLQHTSGRKEARDSIDQALRSELGSFFEKFFNIGRSAYVGARYGKALGGGDGILANAPMIGLFGEFRGGLLSGLKLYYDFIPTQKKTSSEVSEEFSWSRFQLGYSFGRKLGGKLVNWVDVTPKLGVTSMLLRSTPTPDSTSTEFEFSLHRAPTLGLEIGAEQRTNLLLARLWAYGSYSLGFIEIDKERKSSSIRTGLDLYREIISWRTLKLALLGFGAFEKTTIKRKVSEENLDEGTNILSEITYSSLYVGGGMTLTW